ncbi:MAG: hypothetical protein AAFX94_14615 [Myxococcota bacterium]
MASRAAAIELSPKAEKTAELLFRNPKPLSWLMKRLRVKHKPAAYRYLHELHELGFDVCRRGFEHFDDITYSIENYPAGLRPPRGKKS